MTPVAIVTGSGSGIGRATAQVLSQAGYAVVLAGRRVAPLEATGRQLAGPWLSLPTDMTDPAQVHRLIDTAVGQLGRVDVLVNNAGIAPQVPIEQTDASLLWQVMATNALGPAVAIARLWPVFRRQFEASGPTSPGACVVNISSRAASDPFPGFFAYAASKAALESLVRSCAREGAAIGVRAFAIAPGTVETPMLRALWPASVVPPDQCLSPEAVAATVLDCVLGRRDQDNGRTITLDATGR